MTAAAVTFQGTTLPDCFVGVPYLAGLPVKLGTSVNITALSLQPATGFTGFPPGLATVGAAGAGLITGTVQVTSTVGSQLDGPYTGIATYTDSSANTGSATITINVHYLSNDQDLSPAAQAAIRAGEALDNTGGEDVGATAGWTGLFPTAPTMPTDVG